MGSERRLKRLRCTPQFVMSVLYQHIPKSGLVFSVSEMEGIPDGTEVHHVGYDLISDAFVFFLEHPSFEPVPEGEIIPEITPKPTFRTVLVKKHGE